MSGTPGRYVELEDTVSGFEAILSGEADEIPENSFAYVGSIDEAFDKSKDEKTTKKETKNEDLQDSSIDEVEESDQEVSEEKDEAPISES